jgi:signal transduction histidine kinase
MTTRHRCIFPHRFIRHTLILVAAIWSGAATASPEDSRSPVGPRPVPGWPVILGNSIIGTPAVADIDDDGNDEITVAVRDGRVFLLDGQGRTLPDWPQAAANGFYHAPLLADVDGNGAYEIFACSSDGYVHAWRTEGSRLPGWPVAVGVVPGSAPILHRAPGGEGGSILMVCFDGSVHLFGLDGDEQPGWPRKTGERPASRSFMAPSVASADLDGDSSPEILYISWDQAKLYAWNSVGESLPGFPRVLGQSGIGVVVEPGSRSPRIACTTESELVVLNAGGETLLRLPTPDKDDWFQSGAAFLSTASPAGQAPDIIAAGTRGGSVCLWDNDGRPRPGWPIQLGGFIYGISEQRESFAVQDAPCAWDVDGDGDPEILVCSYDQHLYCFELDGFGVPGWPLTLGDAVFSQPAFAQLDGAGRKEMVVGQMGETVYAYHLERPDPMAEVPPAGRSGMEDGGEWPARYFAVAAAIALMLLLLSAYLRFEAKDHTPDSRAVWRERGVFILVVVLLAVRGGIFVDEALRYRQDKEMLQLAEPGVERVIAGEWERVQQQAADIGGALDLRDAMVGGQTIKLLYQMEKMADEHRLDYRYKGLMVTDLSGVAVQALGLARGWKHLDDLDLTMSGTTRPVLMGDTPVIVGKVRVGSGENAGHFFLFSSMTKTLPQAIANAAGVSTRLELDGRSLAWGGSVTPPTIHAWPWLGSVNPAHEILISRYADGSVLSVRLTQEGFNDAASGWLDLGIIFLLPILFYLVSLRRPLRRGTAPKWWWLPSLVLVYAIGLYFLSRGHLAQRPVPIAGHGLEVLLQLAGLLGIAVVFRSFVGARRSRRLSFALLGSYLVVSILPLAVALLVTTSLLQRAQRQVTLDALAELEERADNLAVAYMGSTRFIGELNKEAQELFEQPLETAWFDFVAQDQYLFTYDLPAAYLTLWFQDRNDPDRYSTGYSWRAPRTEKFFSRRPAWTGDRSQKGLFVDKGNYIVRAMRTLRTHVVEAQLVSNIPLDHTIVDDLENRLRILPFLPRVRLSPAWQSSAQEEKHGPGWYLPLSTELVLPARDWTTGSPRWLVYRATAFLPAGSEMWTVLFSIILLVLLPFALSAWGAYYTFRRTVRPMERLLTGIRRVETGDLAYRLADTGRSEIAMAGRAFDRMADSLQAKVQELVEKKKVEEVSELKSNFISMVSHDLKTPLSSIKGAAENVLAGLAGPVTERQRTYLEMILTSSGNLQRMIADLLDLSHIESGYLKLEYETLEIKREAENVLRSVQPLLDGRDLKTEIAVVAENTVVRADRNRLWQIFNNVIANAVRHSPAGGKILISIDNMLPAVGSRSAFLRTTIADEGPGIPEKEFSRIFEPFYARPAGPQGRHGAGLGLAIVKQLVELHGGELTIANRDQGGAAFSFTLPRGDGSTKATSIRKTAPE